MGRIIIAMPTGQEVPFDIKGKKPTATEKKNIQKVVHNLIVAPTQAPPGTGQKASKRQTVTSKVGRGTFAAGGATALGIHMGRQALKGGIAGSRAGPIGFFGGSIAGAGMGVGLFYMADELEARARGIPKDITPEQVLMGVGTEMAIEGGMQGVFGLGFKLTSWGFKGFGKMIGMSRPYVQDIMERTRKVGLPVSALISLTPFTRIVTRVGGVLPIIGAPVKRAIGEIEIRTSEATLGLLGRISPVVDIPALARSLGKSLSISDIGSLRARHTVVDSAIEGLRSIAERAGNPEVIPVQPIVAAATSALKTVREMPKVVRSTTRESTVDVQTVRTPGPKEPEDGFVPRLTETDKVVQEVAPRAGRSTTTEGRTETFGAETTKRVRTSDTALDEQMAGPSPLSKVLTEELENIVLLAERGKMSVTETMAMLEGLLKNVRKADGVGPAELNALNEVVTGVMLSLRNVDTAGLPLSQANAVRGAAMRLSKSWADAKSLETSALLQGLDLPKGFFTRTDTPTAQEFEELASTIIASPQTFLSRTIGHDLDLLMGPENRKALARLYLSKAMDPIKGAVDFTMDQARNMARSGGRTEVITFEADVARRRLGLDIPVAEIGETVGRGSREGLDRLLKGTGVTANNIEDFLVAVENAQKVVSTDPSSFLARRMVLSGELTPPATSGVGAMAAAGAGGALAFAGRVFDLGMFLLGGNLFVRLISTKEGLRILQSGLKLRPTVRNAEVLALRIARLTGEKVFGQLTEE